MVETTYSYDYSPNASAEIKSWKKGQEIRFMHSVHWYGATVYAAIDHVHGADLIIASRYGVPTGSNFLVSTDEGYVQCKVACSWTDADETPDYKTAHLGQPHYMVVVLNEPENQGKQGEADS